MPRGPYRPLRIGLARDDIIDTGAPVSERELTTAAQESVGVHVRVFGEATRRSVLVENRKASALLVPHVEMKSRRQRKRKLPMLPSRKVLAAVGRIMAKNQTIGIAPEALPSMLVAKPGYRFLDGVEPVPVLLDAPRPRPDILNGRSGRECRFRQQKRRVDARPHFAAPRFLEIQEIVESSLEIGRAILTGQSPWQPCRSAGFALWPLVETRPLVFTVMSQKKVRAGIGGLVGLVHHAGPYSLKIGPPVIVAWNDPNRPSVPLGRSVPRSAFVYSKRNAGNDRKRNGHRSFRSDSSASMARNGMRRSRISAAVR